MIKVLAVDDDGFMRDVLHRVLADAGMQVASFGSAAELLGASDLSAATVSFDSDGVRRENEQRLDDPELAAVQWLRQGIPSGGRAGAAGQ